MGKKSRAAKGLPPKGTGGDGVEDKKLKNGRCVSCFSTVRLSKGQGHRCVGCCELFCQKCEARDFRACPNESIECECTDGSCIYSDLQPCVRSVRRCSQCRHGTTLQKAVNAGSKLLEGTLPDCIMAELSDTTSGKRIGLNFNNSELNSLFQEIVDKDDNKLTIEAQPLRQCGSASCNEIECFACLTSEDDTRLRACSLCNKIRCRSCSLIAQDNAMRIVQSGMHAASGLFLPADEKQRNKEKWKKTKEIAVAAARDAILPCNECGLTFCFEDMSTGVKSYLGIGTNNTVKDKLCSGKFCLDHCERPLCNQCYWKAKPCTNPSCPNELGIPTKRCGDCRIARYCSKDCQAEAYPEHKTKCEQMQRKIASDS